MKTVPMTDLTDLAGRTVDMLGVWADANPKLLRELVDVSATTAKEGVRLYAEIQSSALEAAKEGQSYLLRRQDAMQEAPRDPFGAYQKGALDAVESVQRAYRRFAGTAQPVTQPAHRDIACAETSNTRNARCMHCIASIPPLS